MLTRAIGVEEVESLLDLLFLFLGELSSLLGSGDGGFLVGGLARRGEAGLDIPYANSNLNYQFTQCLCFLIAFFLSYFDTFVFRFSRFSSFTFCLYAFFSSFVMPDIETVSRFFWGSSSS